MASYSEVKAGLDDVAPPRWHRLRLPPCRPTFADVVATINAFGTSNASEALSKADLASLTREE